MITNQGNRENNEDSIGMIEKNGKYCFVLCDGLGGHGMGEIASQIAVDTIVMSFMENTLQDFIPESIVRAQNAIIKKQKESIEFRDMKTTVTVLTIDSNIAKYGYVGDSRVYIFCKNKLKNRSIDHSVPQMLVLSKEIKEKEIRNHPDRNKLLRVLGMPWEEPKHTVSEEFNLNDKKRNAFLLCSDGFWELITEKDMIKTLKKSHTVKDWLLEMEAIVRTNGNGKNMDNYSAIGVWVDDN